MQYDLIIKNGTVIDGSGLPRFQADVGVVDGKILSLWPRAAGDHPPLLTGHLQSNLIFSAEQDLKT